MDSMDTLTIKTENKFRSLITKQAYQKGEIICEIPTEKLFDKANRYTVQISQTKHTEVGKLSALNHSCDPNVILDTENLQMIACRDIAEGEELSFCNIATCDHLQILCIQNHIGIAGMIERRELSYFGMFRLRDLNRVTIRFVEQFL